MESQGLSRVTMYVPNGTPEDLLLAKIFEHTEVLAAYASDWTTAALWGWVPPEWAYLRVAAAGVAYQPEVFEALQTLWQHMEARFKSLLPSPEELKQKDGESRQNT
ncbi:MAG: hypothetical protein D6802_07875 [Ardenticatenia bacterium]|nr:MAG: hypothetical protein D6802_07875 [Ardenticatenia bacterium]